MSASGSFLSLFPDFSSFLPYLEYKKYASGEWIVKEEDEMNRLFFILSGKASVSQHLANGRSLMYQVNSAGDIVGDVEYYLSCKATCSVQCLTEVTAGTISFRKVHTLDEAGSDVDRVLASALAEKLRSSSFTAARNAGYPLVNRLAFYLCSTEDTFVSSGRMGEISALMGTTQRHLGRVVAHLVDENILKRVSGGIEIVQKEALEDLSSEIG